MPLYAGSTPAAQPDTIEDPLNRDALIQAAATGAILVNPKDMAAAAKDAAAFADSLLAQSPVELPTEGSTPKNIPAPAPAPSPVPAVLLDTTFKDLVVTPELVTASDGFKANTKLIWPRKDVINKERQLYVPLGDSRLVWGIDDGVRIAAIWEDVTIDGVTRDFKAGCLSTYGHLSGQYGYIEVTVSSQGRAGIAPAVWLYPDSGKWSSEIDIYEGRANDDWHHAIHMNQGASGWGSGWQPRTGNYGDRATYGVDWQPDYIQFFRNGQPTGPKLPHNIHEHMHLIMNMAVSNNAPDWIEHPDLTGMIRGDTLGAMAVHDLIWVSTREAIHA